MKIFPQKISYLPILSNMKNKSDWRKNVDWRAAGLKAAATRKANQIALSLVGIVKSVQKPLKLKHCGEHAHCANNIQADSEFINKARGMPQSRRALAHEIITLADMTITNCAIYLRSIEKVKGTIALPYVNVAIDYALRRDILRLQSIKVKSELDSDVATLIAKQTRAKKRK